MATTFNVEIPNISPTLVKRVPRDQLTVGKTYFVRNRPAGTNYDYVGILIDDPAPPVQPLPPNPPLVRGAPFFGTLYVRLTILIPGDNIAPWVRRHQSYETAFNISDFYEVIDDGLAELMDRIHIDNSQWYAIRTWEPRLLPEDALNEYKLRYRVATLSLQNTKWQTEPPQTRRLPIDTVRHIMSFIKPPAGKKSRKRRGKRRLKSRSAKNKT